MTGRDRKYVLLIVVAFGAMVAAEMLRPTPIDWRRTYESDDTRPYGSRILFEQLPALFPGMPVTAIRQSPFLVFQDATLAPGNYLFVTETFAPDPAETAALLAFVEAGHTVFVAALRYEGALADTLHLETGADVFLPEMPLDLDLHEDTLTVNFVNAALHTAEGYALRGQAGAPFFARFDTARATVLGNNSRGQVNYVHIRHGSGMIYLNTLPLAFTNVHMLHGDQATYVYKALSYLPVQPVRWDAHYKPLRTQAGTPLRVILNDPALRWAYYVLISSVLLFMVFEARRRERIIPIIEPLRNTTVAFVETVGRLYYEHGDHANLAAKKIAYFLDYIRTRLDLPTQHIDDGFLKQVVERSGVPAEDVQALFKQIERAQQEPVSEALLVALNHQIESFYARSQR